jgi:hypothetical protein
MSNNEIWMERTHGRKSKCKTEFKAVINKVLVSGLVLATVLGSTTPAFAAGYTVNFDGNSATLNNNETKITQEYGISVEAAIKNIKNTIVIVNQMKASGSVSEATLQKLADQLYALDRAVNASGSGVTSEVKAIVTQAEKAVDGVSNAKNVQIALAVVKMDLGFDNVTLEQAKATVTSFKDVPSSHWAYKPIMNMVNKGIIAGTTTPVNGVGTFSPDTPMTRAQFITVVTRYLYSDEISKQNTRQGDPWYQANYNVAINEGLIKKAEFANKPEIMNQAMTRQEMAMVLVRAMGELGEDTTDKIASSRIPDFNKVGAPFKDYVRVAYKEGLIAGTDKAGTFNPGGTLTRAQAATVLNRLIDPSSRTPVSDSSVQPSTPTQTPTNVTGTSWYEGSNHNAPKAGDTVIKADGTKVVIKETVVNGVSILGVGTGVDIWSGAYGFVQEGDAAPDNSPFYKCPTTGEMHSAREWGYLEESTNPNGKYKGDYDGEILNHYWKWDSDARKPGTNIIGYWKWVGPEISV